MQTTVKQTACVHTPLHQVCSVGAGLGPRVEAVPAGPWGARVRRVRRGGWPPLRSGSASQSSAAIRAREWNGRVHARVLLAPLLALLLEAPNGDAAHHGRAGGDWRRPSAAEECTPLCSGALTSSKLQCYRLQQSDGDCPCFPATTAAAPLRPACAVVDEPVLVVEETTGSTYSLVCSTQEVAVPTSTAAGCES